MVLRDWYKRENLLWKFLEYETVLHYQKGIAELQTQGFDILAIVADGRRGIFTSFPGIPIQMCQFHQMQIVKRYITSRPKLQAGVELKIIVDKLTRTDETSFTGWLSDWYKRWKVFLKERTKNPLTGKQNYTHSRLRSAYFSLKHNLDYLFTWERNWQLGIPNTTNSVEGIFSNLKIKIRVHQGLKRQRKQKLVEELLLRKSTTF